MKKFSAYIIASTLCIILILIFNNATVTSIVTGVLASIIVILVQVLTEKIDYIKIWWSALRHWNIYIRISASYLYSIKVNDEYLLIKSERFNQYQPVGGVYKRLDSSTAYFQEIEVKDDNLIPIDDTSKHDLRIRVKGKHLVSFMQWFHSGKDRELSPWREFYEELIRPGYFPQATFPYIFYRHIKFYEHPLRYSDFSQSSELLIADIFELVPNHEQMEFLQNLHKSPMPEKLIWAKEEQIRRRGAIPGQSSPTEISLHTAWTL